MKKKIKDELKYRKRKKIKKIILSVIFCAAAVVFGVWFALLKIESDIISEQYDFVIPYQKRDLSTYITAGGLVEMDDADVVSSDVAQKVKKICFSVGDYVNEGDTVIEFDSEELDERIELLQKKIDETEKIRSLQSSKDVSDEEYYRQIADLELKNAEFLKEQAIKNYNDVYRKYDEYYNLYYNCEDEEKSMQYMKMYKFYEAQLDELFSAAESAENRYYQFKENMSKTASEKSEADHINDLMNKPDDSMEKQLAQLKAQRENLIVKSPRNGVIADIFVREGEVSGKSDLFKVGSLEKYKVKAYISTLNILKVKEGMDIEMTTTLTGEQIIKGKIVRVSEIFDNRTQCYSADIEIEDNDIMSKLKPNINAYIKIITNKAGKLYSVSYDSIVTKNGESWVYIIDKNDDNHIARKVNVKTGFESDFYTEITESALHDGDLVVCGGKNINEGDRIRIRE